MGLSQGALSGLGPKRGAGLYLATELRSWLDAATEFVDENDATEDQPHTRLLGYTRIVEERDAALKKLRSRLPVFVYFNNYFRVRPNLYLNRFAGRVEQDLLDDDRYDYGNSACSSCSASRLRRQAMWSLNPQLLSSEVIWSRRVFRWNGFFGSSSRNNEQDQRGGSETPGSIPIGGRWL